MSVSPHSMPDRNWIVFSADRSNRTEVKNARRREYVENFLDNMSIPYDVLKGVYKGVEEISYIAHSRHAKTIEPLLVAVAKQECTMYLTSHRHELYKAYLRDSSGKHEFIGHLRSVPKEVAQKFDSYTRRLGKYWIVTPFDDVKVDIVARKMNTLLANMSN